MNFRPLLLLLAFAHASLSQEAPPKIPTYVYAFAYAPGLKSIQLKTGDKAYQDLRLSTANIVSPVNAVISDGSISLHREPEANSEVENPVHPLIGKAKLKEGTKSALVVLLPSPPGSKLPYRSLVLEHARADFPMGVYRLINLSTYPVRGMVGQSIVRTKPGGIADLKLQGEPGAALPVRFEFFKDDRWNLLTETRCAVRKDRRWLMCLYEDPRTKRLNIRSIPDRRVPPAETE